MHTILFKALISILTKMAVAACGEKMIEYSLFKFAGLAVKHTETAHDDEWLAEFKKSYKAKQKPSSELPKV